MVDKNPVYQKNSVFKDIFLTLNALTSDSNMHLSTMIFWRIKIRNLTLHQTKKNKFNQIKT